MTADKLQRPDHYVPLSVRFAHGRTGTALVKKFGVEGLGMWACALAAAGRDQPHGQIVYSSVEGLAEQLGVLGFEPSRFTLDEFFTYTGKLKQTRRTRHGRVTYVDFTQWERWNDTKRRQDSSRRSARYREQSERDDPVTDTVTDCERPRHLELEEELEKRDTTKAVEESRNEARTIIAQEFDEAVVELYPASNGLAWSNGQPIDDLIPELDTDLHADTDAA